MTDEHPTRPVEIDRVDGGSDPALEWVPGRRVDGSEDDGGQPRTICLVTDGDGGLAALDTSQDRVGAPQNGHEGLIEQQLGPRLEAVDGGD